MSRRESKHLHIIYQALDRKITHVAVEEVLGLSDRQRRRLIKRVKTEGDDGIYNRPRGRTANYRILQKITGRALRLFKQGYADFNFIHATEEPFEIHWIAISDETLRLWMNETSIF